MIASIGEFGTRLLDTQDLDPVYVALHRARLDRVKLCRWLMAYWTYYSVGPASYIADAHTPDEFWRRMMLAAENTTPAPTGGRWSRGSERRHCRGAAAVKCVQGLVDLYRPYPEHMASYCSGETTARGVMRRVKEHYLFGDWIAFKVADMSERVLGVPVSFAEAEVFMFEQPTQAAILLWEQRAKQWEGTELQFDAAATEAEKVKSSVDYLLGYFKGHQAPPSFNRPLGLQEVETILCKWKSNLGGHYPIGKDWAEVRHSLAEWAPHSATATRLLGSVT